MRDIKVGEIMSDQIAVLSPEMFLTEAIHILWRQDTSGAPVVDKEKHLLGVLNLSDIVEELVDQKEEESPTQGLLSQTPEWWNILFEQQVDELDTILVEEIMNDTMYIAAPNDSISVVARQMREHRCPLIIIADGDKYAGVVTWFDMVALFEDH